MTPEERKLVLEFIDEFIMSDPDPITAAINICVNFKKSQITKLEKEIEELKKENTELKGDT